MAETDKCVSCDAPAIGSGHGLFQTELHGFCAKHMSDVLGTGEELAKIVKRYLKSNVPESGTSVPTEGT